MQTSMKDQSISVCLTTFNRSDLLFESYKRIYDHPLVSQIVIVDDCSDLDIHWKLQQEFEHQKKIKFVINERNLGCYANKRMAVSHADNEWVILFDSDNILGKDYIDRIENLLVAGVSPKTLYQPEFARPHFNFGSFAGQNFTRGNVARFADNATFTTALNAMNYFVNRDEYLRVWEDRAEPWTSDSLLQNYNWLNAGNSIYFVPGLSYEHRIHEGSHYREHVGKNGNLHSELIHKLKLLS